MLYTLGQLAREFAQLKGDLSAGMSQVRCRRAKGRGEPVVSQTAPALLPPSPLPPAAAHQDARAPPFARAWIVRDGRVGPRHWRRERGCAGGSRRREPPPPGHALAVVGARLAGPAPGQRRAAAPAAAAPRLGPEPEERGRAECGQRRVAAAAAAAAWASGCCRRDVVPSHGGRFRRRQRPLRHCGVSVAGVCGVSSRGGRRGRGPRLRGLRIPPWLNPA